MRILNLQLQSSLSLTKTFYGGFPSCLPAWKPARVAEKYNVRPVSSGHSRRCFKFYHKLVKLMLMDYERVLWITWEVCSCQLWRSVWTRLDQTRNPSLASSSSHCHSSASDKRYRAVVRVNLGHWDTFLSRMPPRDLYNMAFSSP